MSKGKYDLVIGLEVHVQLATSSKLFCGDETSFGGDPNTRISEVSLAYPGTLPVLNRKAVELAIKAGIATNSRIAEEMMFDRKNYFYPDLPKGYQITQDRSPICVGGFIPLYSTGHQKNIALTRIHLEEDAGKSVHDLSASHSLIDYNRAGMPLIEIVTEPVIHSVEDVAEFLFEIRRLVRYLGIGDGNMEEGSLRCDVNISLKKREDTQLGSKVEIKNLNSIKFVQKAIGVEIERQGRLLDAGEQVISETRLFNVEKGTTYGMRKKETLTDYRYFPDPDLPPVHIDKEWVNEIKNSIDFIPWDLEKELVKSDKLKPKEARIITAEKKLALYFLSVARFSENHRAAANWVMGPVKSYLNSAGIEADEFHVSPEVLSLLINKIDNGSITFNTASKLVFPALIENANLTVDEHIERLGLVNENHDDELALIIDEVITQFPGEVESLRKGKKKLLGMFMGQIMKKSHGKADPTKARELLLSKIG